MRKAGGWVLAVSTVCASVSGCSANDLPLGSQGKSGGASGDAAFGGGAGAIGGLGGTSPAGNTGLGGRTGFGGSSAGLGGSSAGLGGSSAGFGGSAGLSGGSGASGGTGAVGGLGGTSAAGGSTAGAGNGGGPTVGRCTGPVVQPLVPLEGVALAIDDDAVYVAGKGLTRVDKIDGKATQVWDSSKRATSVALGDDTAYFATAEQAGAIFAVPKQGGDVTPLAAELSDGSLPIGPWAMALHGTELYVAYSPSPSRPNAGVIAKLALSGGEPDVVWEDVKDGAPLAVDTDAVYWVSGGLQRAEFGSGASMLISAEATDPQLSLFGGMAYFSTMVPDSTLMPPWRSDVFTARASGGATAMRLASSGGAYVKGIALARAYVYWLTKPWGNMGSQPYGCLFAKVSDQVRILAGGFADPVAVVVDDGGAYFLAAGGLYAVGR